MNWRQDILQLNIKLHWEFDDYKWLQASISTLCFVKTDVFTMAHIGSPRRINNTIWKDGDF